MSRYKPHQELAPTAGLSDLEPPRSVLPGAARYARIVVGLVLLVALATLAASVALDPYRVLFPDRPNHRNFEPNARAVKVAYLAANDCSRFDGFVLGPSRANFYPTDAVEQAFGGRWYNMAVAGESVAGMHRRGLWILENCRPRHLLVTVDPLQFGWSSDYGSDLLRGEPPETGGPSRARFLLRYLFLPPAALWQPARELLFARADLYRMNLADGTHSEPGADQSATREPPERHGHLPDVCYAPEPIRADLLAANMTSLAALIAAARARGVAVTLLAHPVNQNQLASVDFDQVVAWAETVAGLGSRLLFFGGFNEFSRNDARFFDLGHFDVWLGRSVIQAAARIASAPPDELVGAYGPETATLLRERLAENLAQRKAACARRR